MGRLTRANREALLISSPSRRVIAAFVGGIAFLIALPVQAQDSIEDAAENERGPLRTRVGLGPNFYPSYPGSDEFDVGPLIEFERARGDEPFGFEAPDESFGLALVDSGGFTIGPVASFEGERTAEQVGANVPEVDFTVELGGFAALQIADSFRVRGELRKGLGGHDGLVGDAGADFVARDGDRWLASIGPRVTWADDNYHDAYFGVLPGTALATGIPVYDPEGGVQAVGVAASFLMQFSLRWGIYTYAKYDRLIGDAADSPLVTLFGAEDQFSGGAALTYTFGRGVR